MMRDIKFSDNLVEWTFNNQEIKISSENIIMASINDLNEYVIIGSGEKFIADKIYFYDFSGELLLFCDKQNGVIDWKNGIRENNLEIPNILNLGFFLKKRIIAIMYSANEKEAVVFDLDGNFLCEIEKKINYDMMYFQEYTDYIAVVMEGNSNTEDKYGRSTKNFKLNTQTGALEEISLSY